jgi:hypothetical protein
MYSAITRRKNGCLARLELGYLPFSQSGGQLLFHLISKLYENTSLPYIIRQLPRLLVDTGFGIGSHRSYVIAELCVPAMVVGTIRRTNRRPGPLAIPLRTSENWRPSVAG